MITDDKYCTSKKNRMLSPFMKEYTINYYLRIWCALGYVMAKITIIAFQTYKCFAHIFDGRRGAAILTTRFWISFFSLLPNCKSLSVNAITVHNNIRYDLRYGISNDLLELFPRSTLHYLHTAPQYQAVRVVPYFRTILPG